MWVSEVRLGVAERKGRDRAERERRIIVAAQAIAESEGWNAVTIRRLAEEIEHSQPVLYSHFENRDAIVTAVAVEGFRDLASTLRQAAKGATSRQTARMNVASAYLAFAREHLALYEAMFTMPTGLRFAEAGTAPELRDAFAALAAVIDAAPDAAELVVETFWATLHGLAQLEHAGRIRESARDARIRLVVLALSEC